MMPLAIVTGGQQGIGLAIAKAFAEADHDVVVADLQSGSGAEVLRTAWQVNSRVHCEVTDVSDEASVDALFDTIADTFGRPADVLVNNAAIQFWNTLLDLPLDDWEKTLRVNLTGAFLMTQRFARRLRDGEQASERGGCIINIGSGCNRLAFPNLVSYGVSKGGLEMLTKTSALELGPLGIRVNCIAPGAIETDRTRAETDDYSKRWAPLTPLQRVGTVDDVADAVVALASGSMRYVSGETLAVDGGVFSAAAWPRDY